MTDYKKKKQLIEENKDMYISDYDKTLSYDALSQIVEAKKSYAEAAKAGDKEGMTKSNNLANAVRSRYGGYTGGEFGDKYIPFGSYEASYDDYESKYENELDSLYDAVKNGRTTFEYDYEEDPVYQAYKKVYTTEGALAHERALAENSFKTGGMENSNARTAATQALGYYNALLASKIPELYEAAYKRYYDSERENLSRTLDAYSAIKGREERDYSRHLDRLADARAISELGYQKEADMLDRAYKAQQEEADRELDFAIQMEKSSAQQKSDSQKILYDLLRDTIDDKKWRATHNLSAAKAKRMPYSGDIGTASVLDYAKILFGRDDLTMDELYNLLGI